MAEPSRALMQRDTMKTNAQVSAGMLIASLGIFSCLAQNKETSVLTNVCVYQSGDAKGTNCGRAEFEFNLSSRGKYYVLVQGKGISGPKQELWVSIDKEPDIFGALEFVLTNEVPGQFTGFSTNTPRCFDIPEGPHKLVVVGKSANTRLEKLTLVPESSLPQRPLRPGTLTTK